MKDKIVKRIVGKFNKKESVIIIMMNYAIEEGYSIKESEKLIEKFLMQ